MKVLGWMLLLIVMCGAAMAQSQDGTGQVPEIDGSSAAGALAFLSGAIVLVRSRRGRQ